MSEKKLHYFADPMCSWCWGFSPYLNDIVEHYGEQAPIQFTMGGLRPFNKRPLDASSKDMIRSHWEHVAKASGQPFDYAFFEREGFVYDTEPACRAVVTARNFDPARELDLLKAVQGAFYRDNRDVTDSTELANIAASVGFDEDQFSTKLQTEEMKTATLADFQLARKYGVSGYPTLLCGDEDGYGILTVGWQPWERIQYAVDSWLQ